MKRIYLLLLISFIAGSLVSCGNRIEKQHKGKGYVSLSTAVTEELYLLGVGDRLIGDTTYCRFPPAARKVRKVGNLMQPNMEEIARLNPEIVFVSNITLPETRARLRSFGPRVIMFNNEKSMADIEKNFLRLGRVVGRETQAIRIWKQALKDAALVKKDKTSRKPRVFIEVGANPLVTSGRNTYLDEIVHLTGSENIVSKKIGYITFSREAVLRSDPDVILLVTMGDVSAAESRTWMKFPVMKATKPGGICVMDADTACRPTPVAFVQTLKMTRDCFRRAVK